MEPSPLRQDERPTTFQPKIAQLYDDLFQPDDPDLIDSDGFWREFFLLRPEKAALQRRLDQLHPDDLVQLQHESQQLFARAVSQISLSKAPADENALDTLVVFLNVVLSKKFLNPSAEIATVLAGLEEVDAVFVEFASAVEKTIRSGRSFTLQSKAIDLALAFVSGAFQTSLGSYFTHRDLFPALIRAIQATDNARLTSRTLLLLGLLSNYNKFEFRNPYRVRLEDFVNETAIQRLVQSVGNSLLDSRNRYVAIQEDVAEGWTLSNTLAYVGLGILAPSRPATPLRNAPVVEVKADFPDLPDPSVALLLGVHDFVYANKVFSLKMITATDDTRASEPPFSVFLSFTSYLLHHAHRSSRATTYGMLSLMTLRLLIEDAGICKIMSDSETISFVRLCRQRQPFLPLSPKPRPHAAHILDILIDTINHNLRRHLDMQLYIAVFGLIHRILSYLAFSHTRLTYHWSLLWQTMISFLRFLTTYSSSFAIHDPDFPNMLKPVLDSFALCVVSGESFLPDPASYDDLFYKLVEAGENLVKFRDTFGPRIRRAGDATAAQGHDIPTLDVMIQVSGHYQGLVQAERDKGRLGNNPSPRQISKIIRQGYESLSLPSMEGLERWERFREVEEKALLKRMARTAVEDAKQLLRSE